VQTIEKGLESVLAREKNRNCVTTVKEMGQVDNNHSKGIFLSL
jgi:hypothetical protein